MLKDLIFGWADRLSAKEYALRKAGHHASAFIIGYTSHYLGELSHKLK